MITLSRLNGHTIAVNPDLITWIEVTPDTTLSLLGGDKVVVREPLDLVIARVVEFRRSIGAVDSLAYPPSRDVVVGASAHRERRETGRPASTPPPGFRR